MVNSLLARVAVSTSTVTVLVLVLEAGRKWH